MARKTIRGTILTQTPGSARVIARELIGDGEIADRRQRSACPHSGENARMRVIVTEDRNWYVPELAEQVINRRLLRYGPGLVIVHCGSAGIDRSFAEASGALGSNRRPTQPAGGCWTIPRR